MAAFDNEIYQWRLGERRLEEAPAGRGLLLERIITELVKELRRRLGGRFTVQELLELYGQGTSWCMQIAMALAPEEPWAWDTAIVADAAFSRYLREAADYAGGKRVLSEA